MEFLFFLIFVLQLLNVQHESWIFENLKKIVSFQNNLKNQKILNLYGGTFFFGKVSKPYKQKKKSYISLHRITYAFHLCLFRVKNGISKF